MKLVKLLMTGISVICASCTPLKPVEASCTCLGEVGLSQLLERHREALMQEIHQELEIELFHALVALDKHSEWGQAYCNDFQALSTFFYSVEHDKEYFDKWFAFLEEHPEFQSNGEKPAIACKAHLLEALASFETWSLKCR